VVPDWLRGTQPIQSDRNITRADRGALPRPHQLRHREVCAVQFGDVLIGA
jgi:hypothetical protein